MRELELGNSNNPHRAIISLRIEIHELLPNGHSTGRPVHKDMKTLMLDGQDKSITINRLEEIIQELKNRCQQR
jgi:phosphoenolpyruvate-protein kinase (PTS system EI component)